MKKTICVHDIQWDLDEDALETGLDLPTSVTIYTDELQEDYGMNVYGISEYLSDTYGFLVTSFVID